MSTRIIVAANRLPVRRAESGWERSPGGLVSALAPILQKNNGVWIGWSGVADEEMAPFHHDGIDHIPVGLSTEEVEDYYLGFSNETIWPLFHDAIRTPDYHRHWWRAYRAVNQRFADLILAEARDGDLVWIHDYQLLLVPGMIRQLAPELKTRFFLHIPFPPVELFARLPWRREVVEGLLGSDVLGFQTPRGARNFRAAATTFTDATDATSELRYEGRSVEVVATPISIDAAEFARIADSAHTSRRVAAIRSELGDPEIILLGADRLDYTKGIDVRFRAYESMLLAHPELAERTKFVQIGVPSRATIRDYVEMKEDIEQLVGRINSTQGSRHYVPIHYIYESLSMEDLVAYYRLADVMVVTPLADGMNLVAKEYVASRTANDGVLVLSEFAGAAQELTDAVLVNPFHVDGIAEKMLLAIEMDPDERQRRMKSMRSKVLEHDVHRWAASALADNSSHVAR